MRAMERDPLHRYRDARELAWDLKHPKKVAVGACAERRNSGEQTGQKGRVFSYLFWGVIPLLIFALLLYVARHN